VTGFKPGDWVHVEFDGEVVEHSALHAEVTVQPKKISGPYGVPENWCTLIRPPLKVGDVLTANDPEPPLQTVLFLRNRNAVQRFREGWCPTYGEDRIEWNNLASIGARVLYLDADL
jgi:hypothetical protein